MDNKKSKYVIIGSVFLVLCILVITIVLVSNNNKSENIEQNIPDNPSIENNDEKDNQSDEDDEISKILIESLKGDRLEEKSINNEKVKELFTLTGGFQSKLTSYSVIDQDKSLSEYTDKEKLALILEYGHIKTKPLTKDMVSTLTIEEQEELEQFVDADCGYVTKDDLIEYFSNVYGYQPKFENDDISNTEICPTYQYYKSIDKYVVADFCGGDSDIDWTTFIYDYQEINDEIRVITIVYNNIDIEGFYLNNNNIDYFNKIEYVFKKTDSNNYIISDINILNRATM